MGAKVNTSSIHSFVVSRFMASIHVTLGKHNLDIQTWL